MCLSWPCSVTSLTGCSRWWASPARRRFTVGSRWPVEDEGAGRDDPRHRAPGAEAGLHDDAGTAGRRLERRRDDLGGRRPDRRRRLHLGVHDRWRPPGETDPRRHRGASRPIHRAGRNRNRRQPGPRSPRAACLRAVGAAAGGHHGRSRARVRTALLHRRSRGCICLGCARRDRHALRARRNGSHGR